MRVWNKKLRFAHYATSKSFACESIRQGAYLKRYRPATNNMQDNKRSKKKSGRNVGEMLVVSGKP
eukprot:2185535-Karenia_brevis.AAC.1